MRKEDIVLVLLTARVINKILNDETQQIMRRSSVRRTLKTSPNLRLNPPEGEDQPQDLRSEVSVHGRSHSAGSEELPHMYNINFDDFLGRTLLLPIDENWERKQATISDHVWITLKLHKRINSGLNSKLMENNLMTYLLQPAHGVLRGHS